MHVLLIHKAYAGPDDPGGTRHFELASHCVGEDFQFTVVASDVCYRTGRKLEKTALSASIAGILVIRARTPATLHRGVFWRLVAFIGFTVSSLLAALRVRDVDVFMGTSPPMFQAASAWLASALRRRPFVLEIRDLWPDSLVQGGVLRNRLAIGAFLALERFLYRRASRIIVNSPAYKDYLAERKGVRLDRIAVIPNGVETHQFDPDSSGEIFRQRNDLQGSFVALYAGAIGVANDIPVILQAAEMLRAHHDVVFVLVGDGNTRKACEKTIAERHLTNVRFVGTQPKSAMPEVLAAADVCLATLKPNPVYANVYPNKVFDYMAAARPTVFSIDGVIRAVLEAASGGLYVRPRDPSALADAVLCLRGDPTLAAGMGRSARSYVGRHFERREQARLFASTLLAVSKRDSQRPDPA